MRLVVIASFFVLLCSLFETAAAVNHKTISNYDMMTSINKRLISKTCTSGVKSVSLILFTKDNLPQGEVVNVNKSCERFDHSKKIIFLTHGFSLNPYLFNFSVLAAKLVERNYTVFSLAWSQATVTCYNDLIEIILLKYPVEKAREIGTYLASFIKSIIRVCHVPLENITLLGHSLGTHISSFAAKNIFNSGYGKPPLLIGIDPVGILFETKSCTERFCIKDAIRVVVIHTSIMGTLVSLGHTDLWFNNGTNQPACGSPVIDNLNIVCNHVVGIDYVAVTLLTNCVYFAVPVAPKTSGIPSILSSCPCNKYNCTVVDDSVIFDKHSNVTGDYCVSTLSTYPYCKENDFSCKATNSAL